MVNGCSEPVVMAKVLDIAQNRTETGGRCRLYEVI
ncbi:hypothetical protein L861_20215 [Litchfieldella anticariensis FP35 = DSM 16096]|uniref:Uncharacterized protein n=1 Tax=Litchfieldella anticariensis (strain DSM 16096 / CECT 5854 / CIP 108499 / LMG 22089 / FP35) TaxID=1121939 RepID=S2L2P6_LITA3|nr:hypothetical protein L861_20215 [Halomonas anticariensis FP35 = DSM 16096]